MAAPLNVDLLYNFNLIFPFLLVWVLTYAVMGYTKALNDNKALHAMVAVILAFMALYSPIAVKTIQIMAPYFIIFMIFIVFLMLTVQTVGIQHGTVMDFFKSGNKEATPILWWIASFGLVIGFGSFFAAIAQTGGVPGFNAGDSTVSVAADGTTTVVAPSNQEQDFFQTLFHPKVLGMIFILLVALFTVNRLAAQ